ncbi:PspA/IM30 family protein [Atlantibacter subterraneus]|uniref:PspA/IM30 family protein n=1 Tax=Atlantibacter subterraneus TaxID=255519 RepID=UPI002FDE4C9A
MNHKTKGIVNLFTRECDEYLKKLFTLGRSLVNETETLIEETQGIRLLEQHIRDARAELDKAGESRVDLLARVKLSRDKLQELNARKATLECRAVEAMQKQVDESLLLEVAEEISRLETVIASEESVLHNFEHSRDAIEKAVAATSQRIAQFEHQLEVVKATEAMQRAQQVVTTSTVGASSSVATAADSLKRLQARQTERQARLEAAESLEKIANGCDLDEKLSQAGVGGVNKSNAQDVLARLKNQRNG